MSTVGVKDLRNHLTAYLRQAKKGKEVVVTERGKPIALLQPIQSATQPISLEARLAKLAAQGRITLPTRKLRKRIKRVHVKGVPISHLILEDRG